MNQSEDLVAYLQYYRMEMKTSVIQIWIGLLTAGFPTEIQFRPKRFKRLLAFTTLEAKITHLFVSN